MKNFNTINFMYFANNFSRQQMHDCLNSTGIGSHLISKWGEHSANHNSNGTLGFLSMFMQISDKDSILNWIEENYNHKG